MNDKIKEGTEVCSADGEYLGRVVKKDDGHFVVEKGFVFPKSYSVGYDQVTDLKDGKVRLLVRRDQLVAYDADDVADEGAMTASASERTTEVPLVDEEIVPETTIHAAENVRIHKTVVTEMRSITVPVRREELRIERIPSSGEGKKRKASDAPFEDETIEIILREEHVEVTKRPVVREVVRISKRVVESEQHFDETVRHERADIDEEGVRH